MQHKVFWHACKPIVKKLAGKELLVILHYLVLHAVDVITDIGNIMHYYALRHAYS